MSGRRRSPASFIPKRSRERVMATDKPLYYLTIHEAHQLIQKRELSPVDLARAMLERIEAVDGEIHAYYDLMADSAMAAARGAEAEILQGRYRGPLHGIPV